MVAWMDAEALRRTVATGAAHLLLALPAGVLGQGRDLGNTQRVVEVRRDCDGDTLLVLVDQTGVACHTGDSDLLRRRADPAGSAHRRPPVVVAVVLGEAEPAVEREGGRRSRLPPADSSRVRRGPAQRTVRPSAAAPHPPAAGIRRRSAR